MTGVQTCALPISIKDDYPQALSRNLFFEIGQRSSIYGDENFNWRQANALFEDDLLAKEPITNEKRTRGPGFPLFLDHRKSAIRLCKVVGWSRLCPFDHPHLVSDEAP